MRAALLGGLLLAGCQSLVGIEDPIGGECTLLASGECGEGNMCDFDYDLDRTACRPIGMIDYGQPCGGQDDCAEGTSCAEGLCRTLCTESIGCTQADEAECLWSKGSAYVCDNSCDVFTLGSCRPDFECEIEYNYNGLLASACVPTGWFGDAEQGEDCFDLTGCVESLGCIDLDEDGTGVCMPLCEIGTNDCPAGASCDFELGTLHGTTVGVCRP